MLICLSALNSRAQDEYWMPKQQWTFIAVVNGNSRGSLRGQDYSAIYISALLNYYPMKAYGITSTGTINTYYAAKYYLFGTSLATMKYNFINTSTYTILDINTCTYNSSGITTSASTNKCVNLNFNCQSNGSDTMGIQIYMSSISTTGANNLMGASAANFTYIQAFGGNTIYYGIASNGNDNYADTAFARVSNYVERRASPNYSSLEFYQNGVLKKTSTSAASTRPNYTIYGGANNASGSVNQAITGTISYMGITSVLEMSTAKVLESYNIDEIQRKTQGK